MSSSAGSATTFFDRHADRWAGLYARKASFRDRLALFVGAIQRAVPPGARVLDLGCGAGNISIALAERGYEVLGVDGAPEMIRAARAEAQRREVRLVEFREADVTRLSLKHSSFDAIVCSSVIEYVPDDAGLVVEMCALLRSGGRLVISVPHAGSLTGWAEDLAWQLRVGAARDGRAHLRYSLRRYGRDELLRALGMAGLGEFRCTYFEMPLPGPVGVWLSRLPPLGVMLMVEATKGAE